jgi:hypothetical protein
MNKNKSFGGINILKSVFFGIYYTQLFQIRSMPITKMTIHEKTLFCLLTVDVSYDSLNTLTQDTRDTNSKLLPHLLRKP